MADQPLFYRPRSRLLTTLNAYLLAGPAPSRPDDPAIRFGRDGVDYHEAYRRGTITHLDWDDIRAVSILPGPIEGRRALCVYPWRDTPPPPDITVGELFSGSGAGLGVHFRSLFGTPYAVHMHHARGPSLGQLARRMSTWTAGRLTLTTTRPR